MKIKIFLLLQILHLLSCSTDETFVEETSVLKCPVEFLAINTVDYNSNCKNQLHVDSYKTKFIKNPNGDFIISKNIRKNEDVYIYRNNNYEEQFIVKDIVSNSSSHSFSFTKENMDVGTQISFYLAESKMVDSNRFIINFANQDPRPSKNLGWNIYIQRDLDSTYSIGYYFNGIHSIVADKLKNVSTATFTMQTTEFTSKYDIDILDKISPTFSEKYIIDFLAPLPRESFQVIGIRLIDEVQEECITKNIMIKPFEYSYHNIASKERVGIGFSCKNIYNRD